MIGIIIIIECYNYNTNWRGWRGRVIMVVGGVITN